MARPTEHIINSSYLQEGEGCYIPTHLPCLSDELKRDEAGDLTEYVGRGGHVLLHDGVEYGHEAVQRKRLGAGELGADPGLLGADGGSGLALLAVMLDEETLVRLGLESTSRS